MSLPLQNGRFAAFPPVSILQNRLLSEPTGLNADFTTIRKTLMSSGRGRGRIGSELRSLSLAAQQLSPLFLVLLD